MELFLNLLRFFLSGSLKLRAESLKPMNLNGPDDDKVQQKIV